MSIRLMTDILDGGALDLTLAQRFLLVILADFADDDGTCWPKVSTLAKRLNVKERQTQKHLATLQQKGYIEIIQKSKGHSSNVYRIRGVDNDTCRKVHLSKSTPVREDTPRPVREDTPPILYKEPSIEPSNTPSPSRGKRGTQIPDKSYFDMSVAEKYSMNPDIAFEIFELWATSKGQIYKDWNAAWRKACCDWLPERHAKVKANQQIQSVADIQTALVEPINWHSFAIEQYPQLRDKLETEYKQWDDLPQSIQEAITEDIKQ